MGKKLLISFGVLLVSGILVYGWIFVFGGFQLPKNSCGDGVCGIDENCNDCEKDCLCGNDEYCSRYNSCLKSEFCGDEICTNKEKQERDCCIDCEDICEDNKICNEYTKKCISKFELSQDSMDGLIGEYPDYTLLLVDDIYYKNIVAKEMIFDCTSPEDEIKCRFKLIVSKDGNILNEGAHFY